MQTPPLDRRIVVGGNDSAPDISMECSCALLLSSRHPHLLPAVTLFFSFSLSSSLISSTSSGIRDHFSSSAPVDPRNVSYPPLFLYHFSPPHRFLSLPICSRVSAAHFLQSRFRVVASLHVASTEAKTVAADAATQASQLLQPLLTWSPVFAGLLLSLEKR